jgi:hypothetical protein
MTLLATGLTPVIADIQAFETLGIRLGSYCTSHAKSFGAIRNMSRRVEFKRGLGPR